METIMLNGVEVTPHEILKGFEIQPTPASTYTSLIAMNVDKGELIVMFRNGKRDEPNAQPPTFFYSPIDPLLLHQMKNATSTGQFFAREIKGHHKGQQLYQKLFTPVKK